MIPAGTANDYARATGLPRDRVAAAELAVTGTELRRYELGRLGDGHPFVNVASAGLASVAARRADPLKPRLGPLAYAAGAVHAAVAAAPLPCTRARGRRDGVRGRGVAGDRRRHRARSAAARASAPPTRPTASST